MQSVQEVLAVIGQHVQAIAPRRRGLADAQGAVLAESVRMDIDSPPFDRAVLDGYAVRSAEAHAGARLGIIGRQDAGGTVFDREIGPGQCLGINTGGPMPAGADAVVMVEHAQIEQGGDAETIIVEKGVGAGYGVQRRGADARAGEGLLEAGVRLGAAQLAVAASAGAAELLVRRPRVAVLATGDELVEPSAAPGPGQIRNSNGPMLAALVCETGADLLDLGTCGDQAVELRRRLEQGFEHADLLLVSGGMSMGTRDLVPPMLKEMGLTVHVEKVRMKPGKPFLFGTLAGTGAGRRYVAGLPGNPVSGFVTFQRFVREVLGRMSGLAELPRLIEARAATAMEANGDREFYQPGEVSFEGGIVYARPRVWKGSADLFSLGRSGGGMAALLVREAGAGPLAAGGLLRALLL